MARRTSPSRKPSNDERGASWPWVGVVGLAAFGLALSIYLLQEHYVAWTNPNIKALCDINASFSCSTVARTPYAVFLGVPVAAWGVLGYLVIAGTGFWGWFDRKTSAAVTVLGLLAAVCTVTSLVLGIISKLAIGVLCPFCVGTYGVNGALAVLAIALFVRSGWRQTWNDSADFVKGHLRRGAQLSLLGSVAIGLLVWLYPKYWLQADPLAEQLRAMPAPPPSTSACADSRVGAGVTADGHPWIGARTPKVTITEFSDYQCPFCALAHAKVRALIEAHPTLIRVVHRHFPLDEACNPIIPEPFHPNACYYAGLAVCAGEQDKFWAANDHLYLHGRDEKPIEVPGFSAELGLDRQELEKCLADRAWSLIRPDLEDGIRLQLRGTPTFLVDGKVHMGADPAEIIAPYLPDGGPARATPTKPDPRPGVAAVAPDANGSATPSGLASALAPPMPTASVTR
ncbi:MAG: thioredoxin domain-containing protein [Polyangiaceae bacterium]|nr:thioredoxin domain-containing protein [Polyangiaceae bacterium]